MCNVSQQARPCRRGFSCPCSSLEQTRPRARRCPDLSVPARGEKENPRAALSTCLAVWDRRNARPRAECLSASASVPSAPWADCSRGSARRENRSHVPALLSLWRNRCEGLAQLSAPMFRTRLRCRIEWLRWIRKVRWAYRRTSFVICGETSLAMWAYGISSTPPADIDNIRWGRPR